MTHTHIEKHFTAGETVRDIIIGMSDGLTVPFALAAGLSGAIASTQIIVTAGLAEIAAGSIAMGLGGYLAARNDVDHYRNERLRELREIEEIPAQEEVEIIEIFRQYGIASQECSGVITALKKNPQAWVDFMMRFELGLEQPDANRAITSALSIGGAYMVGGLIPLLPYLLLSEAPKALVFSATVTLLALLIFGYIKGKFTGKIPWRSALETTLIGGLAALVAFGIASLFTE